MKPITRPITLVKTASIFFAAQAYIYVDFLCIDMPFTDRFTFLGVGRASPKGFITNHPLVSLTACAESIGENAGLPHIRIPFKTLCH